MMKFWFIYSLCILYYVNLFSQKRINIINQGFYLSSQWIETSLDSQKLNQGTSFLIKKGNNVFLVSNYHVLSGRPAQDTTQSTNKLGLIPNTIIVSFQARNRYIGSVFKLLNGDERLFVSFPANKETKRTIDIAILPIVLPAEIMIKWFPVSKLKNKWLIPRSTTLTFCGFVNGENSEGTYPSIFDIKTVSDRSFNQNDQFIFAYDSIGLHGSSGSPVYYIKNKIPVLVGIISSAPSPEYFPYLPELKNSSYNAPILEIIPSKTIIELLNKFPTIL
jgi:hypothetical protein